MSATGELLVVAGEVSGDIHAGNLVAALGRIAPDLHCFGIGGDRLEAAGLELLAHTSELAHMGLTEVVRELPRLRRLMQRVASEAIARTPRAAVLVDSPDFNLRLAKRLSRAGIPVILYVSPQLWAWRRGRVRLVRRVAREVLCILPFEVGFYEEHHVRARYVGHPLVDDLAREGLLEHRPVKVPGRLALLPGSRAMEVRQLLPGMLEALALLPEDTVREACVIVAPGMEAEVGAVLDTGVADQRLRTVSGADRRRELAKAEAAWAASGTATLECALLDVPMIVGYRLGGLSFFLARLLVRVPHIALANLIAGERAAPELIQHDWNGRRLAGETVALLDDGLERQHRLLERVRERLGRPGASERAALAVMEYLDGAEIGEPS
ncbi:MAG TPA: lipid-A-disaccharide synthase [Acidobacteria bacterium]|nr:lipid-A-disaccharide synthase [Acidobacteriota bacterium]